MALVVDAVSHLFHHPSRQSTEPVDHAHRPHTPARQPASHKVSADALQESPRPRTPMSASANRAVSSQASSHPTPQVAFQPQDEAPPSQHGSPPARSVAQQPPSPPLPAHAEPPPDAPNAASSLPTPSESAAPSGSTTPKRIKIRDLAHIQSLAGDEMRARTDGGRLVNNKSQSAATQYEISGMPIENIIEMVAGLLTKITTTNDKQHEHLHRQIPPPDANSMMSAQTSSVLAFHGKNVPSITILSYLNRINKYCPTSYEVFLSLLVYFDRMTVMVNAAPMQSLREHEQAERAASPTEGSCQSTGSSVPMDGVSLTGPSQTQTPPLSGEIQKQDHHKNVPGTPHSRPHHPDSPAASYQTGLDVDALTLSQFFVVDSFNIHRLVIAGVTCASKFFSDIFYTNSRYAKVGGLPLPELNHLELQFLLLNDFRLSVPVEEMEKYGTMLVEFYAREVLAQKAATSSNEAPVQATG